MSGAEALKTQGNAAFAAKRWREAAEFYSQALAVDPKLAAAYANRAACMVQVGEWDAGRRDCECGLALDPPKNLKIKLLWRKSVCERSLGLSFDATVAAGRALDPTNKYFQCWIDIPIAVMDTLPTKYCEQMKPAASAAKRFVPPPRPLTYSGVLQLVRCGSADAYDFLEATDLEELVAAHRGIGIDPETVDFVRKMASERGGPRARALVDALSRCHGYDRAAKLCT